MEKPTHTHERAREMKNEQANIKVPLQYYSPFAPVGSVGLEIPTRGGLGEIDTIALNLVDDWTVNVLNSHLLNQNSCTVHKTRSQ